MARDGVSDSKIMPRAQYVQKRRVFILPLARMHEGEQMRYRHTLLRNFLMSSLLVLLTGMGATAQKKMTIQATASGTSTQLGKMVDVTIYIEQFSTSDDKQTLIDAFKKSGQEGLVDKLQDMKPKGRVRFSGGGVGNDVKYIVELPSDKGRRFRLITDRNLAFGELYAMTRSEQYDVGAIELTITPDGKGSGTVLPACKLTVNKKKQQVEIETFQNPWNLSNFRVSND